MITEQMVEAYLCDCRQTRRLNEKTIKAYACDLRQLCRYLGKQPMDKIRLERYLIRLHEHCAPRTVKRKIASIHAFFQYLVYQDRLRENPLHRIRTRFCQPKVLPKTIPLPIIEDFFRYLYHANRHSSTLSQKKLAVRNIALFELLFATGIRVSELCHLRYEWISLQDHTLRIHGKGNKERMLYIGDPCTQQALSDYFTYYEQNIRQSGYFFVSRSGTPISDQSIRRLLQKYCAKQQLSMRITPHMFRHTFASLLLEEEVDIRFIQRILGHSSITTTQIYTHVSSHKQKEILITRNPRNHIHL